MPDPIFADEKVLLLETEETYGTDTTPTGAANAILGRNFVCRPMEAVDLPRDNIVPWMGNDPVLHGDYWAVMSFEVELATSGATGVAPPIGPVLRALGCAEVVTADDEPGDGTVTYTPVKSGHESAAIHFHDGPTRHVLLGARGDATLNWISQDVPRLAVTMTGLFSQPTAQTLPTPDFTAFQKPVIPGNARTPAFTYDSVELVLRRLSMSLGNQVSNRFLMGRHEIIIEDRAERISFTVEATPLGTFNPYARTASQELEPLVFQNGAVPGHRIMLEADSCQLDRPGAAEAAQKRVEWPLVTRPMPVVGDDQWTLTFF